MQAVDGQTLSGQSAVVQASFIAVWGDAAESRWVWEHNIAIGAWPASTPWPPAGSAPAPYQPPGGSSPSPYQPPAGSGTVPPPSMLPASGGNALDAAWAWVRANPIPAAILAYLLLASGKKR